MAEIDSCELTGGFAQRLEDGMRTQDERTALLMKLRAVCRSTTYFTTEEEIEDFLFWVERVLDIMESADPQLKKT